MSATTVPIRPIKKGSVAKLWVALAAVSLVAGGVAVAGTSGLGYETTASGLQFRTIKEGEGPKPTATDIVLVDYTGRHLDGRVFDTTEGKQPAPFPVAQVIPGFTEALQMMQKGGSYRIRIPGNLAYGATPPPGSPFGPNEELEFDVTLIDIAPASALGGMGGVPGGNPHGGGR